MAGPKSGFGAAAAALRDRALIFHCTSCRHATISVFGCTQTQPSEGWTWRGPEMGAARRLLRSMTVHNLRCVFGGASCLRRLACAARAASARGVLNGFVLSFPHYRTGKSP